MTYPPGWSAAAAGRRHYYLALPVLLAGILTTASNGALASLVVGVAGTSMMQPRRRPLQWIGAGLMLAAISIVALAATHERLASSSMDLMTRGRDSVGGTAVDGAMERFPLWLDAADSVRRVPTGVGPGNFNREGGSISGVFHGAHNEYLGMLAERGPIGLIGWCAVLVSSGGALLRVHRRRSGALLGIGIEPLIGAVAAFLALNIVALTTARDEVSRSMYLAMNVAGLYVIVPASVLTVLTGVVQGIDEDEKRVFVSCTKAEVKEAPDYDERRRNDADYRRDVGSHYEGDPIGPQPGPALPAR